MDFLSEIIAVKRQRVAAAKRLAPLEHLRDRAHHFRRSSRSHLFAEALQSHSGINMIAEFKRRSPSKGRINSRADPAATAAMYDSAGAAAISVLTEEDYFDGSLDDLRQIRAATRLPILRKDFIIDEYEVYESAAAGADAVLLIVAALDDERLRTLRVLIEDELGMDALVEAHTREELDRAVAAGARTIGINNRDLSTFSVSIATSFQLAHDAPADAVLISESGLSPDDVKKLRAVGFKGFLVGETLMRADDPARALKDFIEGRAESKLSSAPHVQVKICGITNSEDAQEAIIAGADLLGFNFYRQSPRFIEPEAAAKIIREFRSENESHQPPPKMIGVFVDASLDYIRKVAENSNLDGVQLHGDESEEMSVELKSACPSLFQIKAFTAAGLNAEQLLKHPADAIMLDGYDRNLRGGTGKVADWVAAKTIAEQLPRVFLAGGLSPENVAAAINAVHPYGVDACSSLETAPGKKNIARMKAFVTAAHSVTLADEGAQAGEGK
jgi:indole-3-glycerol phosphate synthase/phosphoribosylanthranilate isomerase